MNECKFCGGEWILSEEYFGTRCGIHLVYGNMLAFDNSDREYGDMHVMINYCPLCGRKLGLDPKSREEQPNG